MNDASTRSRSPLRWLALLLAVALTLGAATTALAQPPGHGGARGGGRGAPHMSAPRMPGPRMPEPRMSGPRMGGPIMGGPVAGDPRGAGRYPWAGPIAAPPGRGYAATGRGVYGAPVRGGGYGAPPRSYGVSGRPYAPAPQPAPTGAWNGYPVYASPPGYPAPAGPARAWRRGGYLPPSYPGVVVQDFARNHLRRPPSGYNWVREGNEFLLVSSGTGLIFDVAPAY